MSQQKSARHSAGHRVSFPAACLRGTGLGLALFFLLLLLFALILTGTENPGPLTAPLALCALYLGAIVSGAASARFSGDGAAAGLLGGLFTAGVILLLSLLPLPASPLPSSISLILTGLILPASLLGSVLGRKKENKPRLRR